MTPDLGPGLAGRLPDFPWDTLDSFKHRAAAHPHGVVDLSVGTPVDPVPEVVQRALSLAANAPGYPTTVGTSELRGAAVRWMQRRLGASVDEHAVLPLIGSKEFVAWLPTLLGLSAQSTVVIPELAYPTYEVGARVVGAEVVATDSTLSLGPSRPQLLWLNSPSNPSGRVLPAPHLKKVVDWARERDCLVVSDECYIELGWDQHPVSVLHPDVCGGTHHGVLAVHSLSKRSNLAGYRAAFVCGDTAAIELLTRARKHLGMLMPSPVQAAMVAALDDDEHVVLQRERYLGRRSLLREALMTAGFRIDSSQAGLYLWATRDEDSWASVEWFADRGILVAPGAFYGVAGHRHVRVALTASDIAIEQAAQRLTAG